MTNAPPLNAWQCSQCGTTLARLSLTVGSTVSVKCRRCGAINTIRNA